MSIVRSRTPNLKLNLVNYDVDGWSAAEDENYQIIDAAVNEFIRINGLTGVWRNSTQYDLGAVVVDSDTGLLWVCNVPHVSPSTGTFAQHRSSFPGYWAQRSSAGDTTIVSGGAGVSRPEDFGGSAMGSDPDDPTPDSTAAVQAAITDALVRGQPLQLDGMYRLTARIPVDLDTYHFLTIRGNGGFYCDANLAGDPFIDVQCSPADVIAVTAIANTTFDFAGQGNLTDCTVLTLAAGGSLTPGSLCRLVSDDQLTAGSGTDFAGEVVYIGAVSGLSVYTTARLRNTYSTNPRLAVYKDGKKVLLSSITIAGDSAKNVSEDRKWVGVRVAGVVNPVFERVVGKNCSNAVILTQGCVHSLFTGVRGVSCLNNITGLGITGYLIKDNCGEYTTLIACSGYDCRHLYTADTTQSNSGDPWTFGAPFGGLLSNSQGHNCSASAFDTHPTAEAFVFNNLRTYNTYQGNNTSFSGIQAWGKRHTVAACRHYGGGAGLILGTNIPGETTRHTVRDFHYDGSNFGIYCRSVGTVFDAQDCEIITTYGFGAISLQGSGMVGRDNTYILRGTATNRRVYDLAGSATLIDSAPTIDFSQVGVASSWVIGYRTDGLNTAKVTDGQVKAGASGWTGIVWSDAGAAAAVSAQYTLTADTAPLNTDGIDSAVPLTGVSPLVKVDGVNGYNTAVKKLTPTITANKFPVSIDNCPGQEITREYTVTAAGASVGSVTAGLFKGQRLTVINASDSSQTYKVPALTTNLGMASDIDLSPKSGLSYVWDGVLWLCTSVGVNVTGGGGGVTDHGLLTGLSDDDHPQYHTDARALTWLGGRNLEDFADVPTRTAQALKYLRVNSAATAYEFAKALDSLPGRDIAVIAPTTHTADTASLADASVSLYPSSVDNARTALRLFASTAKGIWLGLCDHAFKTLATWREATDGTAELRLYNATGAAVKTFIGSNYSVFGGDSGQRGTLNETVTIQGDLYVSGSINGPVQPGTYDKPYIIGSVYVWDSGTKLFAKQGTAPGNATDGFALW